MKMLSIFRMKKESDESFINDRRHSKRYDILLKLNYSEPVTSSTGESLTKNICKNGLRFPTEKSIPRDSILTICIEDPYGNNPIRSKARVIWTEEFATGEDSDNIVYEVGAQLIKRHVY